MTTTTSRLLNLLSLLQTRRDWPGGVLADRLAVSHRTVRRDVDRLREMGYSIRATMGPDGGYRLAAGSELPPLLFDDEQVVALAVALQAATATGVGIEEAALRALTSVRQVLPPRLQHRLAALEVTTMPRPSDGPATTVSPDVLLALSAAVRAREVVRFDYAGPTPQTTDADSRPARRVEPHDLVVSSGRWYLVAWDLDRADWRIFRADRISPRTPTRARFVPRTLPGGSAREFVSARFKGSDRDNTWPCTGTVILELPIDAVLPFAGDGTAEAVGTNRTRFTIGSWSWIGLAASLGRFDTEVEVVGPPELTAAFARLARRNAATGAR